MKFNISVICFIGLAMSSTVLQSEWLNNHNCLGPPSSMYMFNVMNPSSPIPGSNETWPHFYSFTLEENPLGTCGSLGVPLRNRCCVSSLDLEKSNNVQSGASEIIYVDNNDIPIKRFANNGAYCILTSNSTISGYLGIYILNNGDCIQNTFTCSSNKLLTVYGEDECKGTTEEFDLSKNDGPNSYKSDKIGNFEAMYAQGGSINVPVSWTTFLPSTDSIANSTSFWDMVQHLCVGLTLAGDLGVTYFIYFHKVRDSKTAYMKLLMFTSIVWIMHDVVNTVYMYMKLPDINSQYILIEITWIFHNLASLLNVLQTTIFLFSIMFPTPSIQFKLIICGVLLLLHLGFAGAYYFGYCWNPYVEHCISSDTITVWMGYNQYWILIMFLWNVIPTSFTAISFFRGLNNSISFAIGKIYTKDKFFLTLIVQQVLLGVIYFTISHIQSSTDLLGNDRVWDTFVCIQMFILTAHAIFNVLLIDQLSFLIRNASTESSTTSFQSSLVEIEMTDFHKSKTSTEINQLEVLKTAPSNSGGLQPTSNSQ